MRLVPADSRLALATDVSWLGPRLAAALGAACPGAEWAQAALTRVLPDGAGGFVSQLTVPTASGTVYHVGTLLPAAGAAAPAWAAEARPGRAWLPDPGLAVAMFPHDPELTRLDTVLSESWRREVAAAVGHDPAGPSVAAAAGMRPRVLGYRLLKRCVVRLSLADAVAPGGAPATVVVKVVRPRRLANLVAAHRSFAAPNPGVAAFALPRVLHVDEARGALVMQDVPGRTLHELIGTAGLARQYAVAGCALREFHGRPRDAATPRTAADELALLASWVELAATTFPALGEAPWQHLHRLAACVDRLAGAPAPVLLHRDFYDKQVLAGSEHLTLLDLDTATAGDAALDLGNFLAHVRLRQLQMPQHARSLAAAGNAFLEAYGAHQELLTRISWWRAAATLRLAALYSLRPRWRALTPQLLEEAETCLRQPERML